MISISPKAVNKQNPVPRKFATLTEKAFASRRVRGALTVLALLLALAWSGSLRAMAISDAEAARIGRRVWQNECAGTIAGLTSWNAGEEFASLGIGHFIWYPQDKRGPFEESFPAFVKFAERGGAKVPVAAAHGGPCPWSSRAEFVAAEQKPAMRELRQFLAETVALQARFLVERLQFALPKMTAESENADNVRRQFARVSSTAQGCYALVDYVNFKGEGVLVTERYRSKGWGLLQVLEGMRGDGAGAVQEFAESARTVLRERVRNSPPERTETKWLPGWLNRLSTYARS